MKMNKFRLIKYCLFYIFVIYFVYIVNLFSDLRNCVLNQNHQNVNEKPLKKVEFTYNKNLKLVFIGGLPGSGLDLMREFLNSHDKISCTNDESAHLLANMIARRKDWTRAKIEKERLKYAGMTDEVIDDGMTSFILQIILGHQLKQKFKSPKEIKLNAEKFCQSNSKIINHMDYLNDLFPNVKFIFMIRDPRATVTYLINKKIEDANINLKSYRNGLMDWDKFTKDIYYYCLSSKSICLPILYEEMLLYPKTIIRKVFKFLNLKSLNETLVNNIINVNNLTRINFDESFNWWRPYFPTYLQSSLNHLSPTMSLLGYNSFENNSTFDFSFHRSNF